MPHAQDSKEATCEQYLLRPALKLLGFALYEKPPLPTEETTFEPTTRSSPPMRTSPRTRMRTRRPSTAPPSEAPDYCRELIASPQERMMESDEVS